MLQERDDQLAIAFNDPRRSQMIVQRAAICGRGLLQPEELARFMPPARGTIEFLLNESKSNRERAKARASVKKR